MWNGVRKGFSCDGWLLVIVDGTVRRLENETASVIRGVQGGNWETYVSVQTASAPVPGRPRSATEGQEAQQGENSKQYAVHRERQSCTEEPSTDRADLVVVSEDYGCGAGC